MRNEFPLTESERAGKRLGAPIELEHGTLYPVGKMNNETKHTPEMRYVPETETDFAFIETDEGTAIIFNHSIRVSESDGRAMAAAPEMLEAAKELSACIVRGREGHAEYLIAVDHLNAAIAKAQGGAK